MTMPCSLHPPPQRWSSRRPVRVHSPVLRVLRVGRAAGQRVLELRQSRSQRPAVSRFPREIIPVPRSWAERAYPNLVYFNELDKGGHFAAWEQPELFAGEMRAAFRSLR